MSVSSADGSIVERLATGAWLDRSMVRAASLISLTFGVLTIAYLWFTRDGLMDAMSRPLGTDFSSVWVAGLTVLNGGPAPYAIALHHAAEKAVFGPSAPLITWHYPPIFLLIAVPLAHLPYLWALAIWQIGSLVPAALSARRILPDRDTLLVAIGFPANLICLLHGHNGFLSAFLFGTGLLVLPTSPILAGALLGCLAYKPQLGLLLPLALLAGGHWRAVLAAGATVVALFAVSAGLFGLENWVRLPASMSEAQHLILDQGRAGWAILQSAFSAVRRWGGSATMGYAVQVPIALAVAATVFAVWRSRAAHELKAATLIVGSLMATPYVIDYDLTVLGPAIAFLAAHGLRRGFGRWMASALALAWIAPLAGRVALGELGLPLGFASLALLLGLAAREALRPEPLPAPVPA